MRLHPCFVPWLSVTLRFVWHSSLWSFNSTTTNHSKKDHFCVTSPQSVTGQPIPEPICKHLIHVLFFALFRCAIMSSVLCMSMISLQRVLSMRSLDRDYSFFTPKKTLAFVVTLWTILVSYLLLPAFGVWGKIGHRSGYPFCTVWKTNEDVLLHPDMLIFFLGYCFPLLFLLFSCFALGPVFSFQQSISDQHQCHSNWWLILEHPQNLCYKIANPLLNFSHWHKWNWWSLQIHWGQ